jgi:tRNA (guanine37-N1)-methyltransferase
MIFEIITIFPRIFDSYLSESLLYHAQKNKLVKVNIHNLRDFTKDKHKSVDDRPFGGGPGMVLKVGPIYRALFALGFKVESLKSKNKGKKEKIILLSPRGKKFNQRIAQRFSKLERIVLICGRYEGVDERVKNFIDEEISIGDYILSGGELPAMVIIEAVTRLIPGVLGNEESLKDLGYPVYTRPREFKGMKVPKVLLSGDHKKIEEWRKKKIS